MSAIIEFSGKMEAFGAQTLGKSIFRRYALAYKGLKFRTIWVEFPDIESMCRKLGVLPTATRRDGSPWYTLPAIYDPSTGVALSESFLIAEYLDKQYPDSPRLMPDGTIALHTAFNEAFKAKLGAVVRFVLPKLPGILNPVSAEFIERTRAAEIGMPLEEFYPRPEAREGIWRKVEEDYSAVAGWPDEQDKWFMADNVSFADLMVAGRLKFFKVIFGEDSDEWKSIASLGRGRFGRMLEDLEKYECRD
ncbi:hypothetical protein VNI00_008780 [Paramarasmius palmivorus]|uniref:GST N-terminal domain-containing protein n=1 Tax=Paramarasmius palmivorus TaxID=297713 RepID=A0AAW0CYZ0_9AGAR